MFHFLWWIPAVFLIYGLQAWFSVKATEGEWKWSLYLWLASMVPLWAIVARCYDKKELNFIGGLYDILLLLTFQITWIFLGCSSHFTKLQWFGLVFVFIGFCLIKITGK